MRVCLHSSVEALATLRDLALPVITQSPWLLELCSRTDNGEEANERTRLSSRYQETVSRKRRSIVSLQQDWVILTRDTVGRWLSRRRLISKVILPRR
jgi:hypothetical protein